MKPANSSESNYRPDRLNDNKMQGYNMFKSNEPSIQPGLAKNRPEDFKLPVSNQKYSTPGSIAQVKSSASNHMSQYYPREPKLPASNDYLANQHVFATPRPSGPGLSGPRLSGLHNQSDIFQTPMKNPNGSEYLKKLNDSLTKRSNESPSV